MPYPANKRGNDMNNYIRRALADVFEKLAWICFGALLTCIIILDVEMWVKILVISCLVCLAIMFLIIQYYRTLRKLKVQTPRSNIQFTKKNIDKIVLLNEENRIIKSWDISGMAGLVIGKNSGNNQVDIDLSDLAVVETISEEHAVLNYANGNWFIEDSDSFNGTGIKKVCDDNILYLNKSEQIKLEPHDYIYIGKAVLQVM